MGCRSSITYRTQSKEALESSGDVSWTLHRPIIQEEGGDERQLPGQANLPKVQRHPHTDQRNLSGQHRFGRSRDQGRGGIIGKVFLKSSVTSEHPFSTLVAYRRLAAHKLRPFDLL